MRAAALLLIAVAAPSLAAAQRAYVPPPPQVYNSWRFHNTRTATMNNVVGKRLLEKRTARPAGPSAPLPPAGSVSFRPVGPPIAPGDLAARAARTPQERAELQQMFGEALVEYEKILKEKGLPLHDVARAASFVLANSYSVLHGDAELSEAQLNGLRAQVREGLARNLEFQRMSDRDKQELYETYAIIGMFLPLMSDIAKRSGDNALAEQVRGAARGQLEVVFGVSATRLYASVEGIQAR